MWAVSVNDLLISMQGAGQRTGVAAYYGLCQLSNEIKDDGEAVCKELRGRAKSKKPRWGAKETSEPRD